MDDVGDVEEMEDRVLDLVFALGGRATIWRSYADHDRSRVVRGLIIEMTPGQDTFSLLVSPEGHLTPVFQIEEAEEGAFAKPPYLFVKTQFGSITGHVAIVNLLDALKERYLGNLEVSDESGYYETRDFDRLKHKKEFLGGAIQSLAEGLREHGLSKEAMEDPNIIAKRIERVAMLVQEKMSGNLSGDSQRSSTHSDDDAWSEPSLEEEVNWMDAQRRKSDLRSERMTRRIAEAKASGLSTEEAFARAMNEAGFKRPAGNESDDAGLDEAEHGNLFTPPSYPFDEAQDASCRQLNNGVHMAQKFLLKVMDLGKHQTTDSRFMEALLRSSLDIVGGLVQSTSYELDGTMHRALTITQLKRAFTGHAYARGAVFGLNSENAITKDVASDLHTDLERILESLYKLMSDAWNDRDDWNE